MAPSLSGRRIAVTRGRSGEDALGARLRELGAEVLDAPAIAIGPPASYAELDQALRAVDGVAWIAFASANAVERTVARAAELGIGAAVLGSRRLAAVGAATAERLTRLVRAPDLVPRDARGEALAAALGPLVAGRRVLVPRAEEGRPELVEGLARAGAEVCAPVAYRTVPVPREELAPLLAALAEGSVDAVVFASPSAVRSVVDALGAGVTLLRRTTVAAIGPTTAAALKGAGIDVDVQPASSTGAALADALADSLGRRA